MGHRLPSKDHSFSRSSNSLSYAHTRPVLRSARQATRLSANLSTSSISAGLNTPRMPFGWIRVIRLARGGFMVAVYPRTVQGGDLPEDGSGGLSWINASEEKLLARPSRGG